jgi:glycosyltransferase involved in cell wall biosynthesis
VGEKLRVLYFGGFIPLHGVPLIVEAARLLGPECGITIELLGDGQEADMVARAVAATAPHVQLTRAWMPERELIAQHIARADVCLGIFADSPKARDVVPAKVYLALACGRPVLTADTPAIREEVLSRTAPGGPPLLTCPPGDPMALAAALRRLGDDPELRMRLGNAARRTYDGSFRPELVVEPLLAVLQELAG